MFGCDIDLVTSFRQVNCSDLHLVVFHCEILNGEAMKFAFNIHLLPNLANMLTLPHVEGHQKFNTVFRISMD